MDFKLPLIYPVTDAHLSGLTHAEQVERLAAGGATLVQLREKVMPPRQFYEEALAARAVASRHGIRLIINDRVDIALVVGADGVHLGQHDMPAEAARALLGPAVIIGLSTHSVEELSAAEGQPVDYLAYGPIFQTETKENADPVVGIDGLRAARTAAGDRPLVAIGGIDGGSLEAVLRCGADSAAMIGALVSDPDRIATRFAELVATARGINVVGTG